ncbi:hypothetical protein E1292_03070 [Nonomuraea deserti]|uniref:Uncharacterized protein n=1 Tax=Nonomuraea deserti TaxID=1848322 RepID=A0A4R4W0Z9_9ACTN|nr:hypothetical protein [Nonomuraea deserti]TDD12112.1 hypothetical protein E1292_03070 [Nonomuraea deserti]
MSSRVVKVDTARDDDRLRVARTRYRHSGGLGAAWRGASMVRPRRGARTYQPESCPPQPADGGLSWKEVWTMRRDPAWD